MNWFLIIVVIFFAWNLVWGYYKGLLLVVYSLTAWLAALIIVTWATPYVSNFVIEYTDMDERIEQRVLDTFHEMILTEESPAASDDEKGAAEPGERSIQDLGIQLPEALTDYLVGTNEMADRFLEDSGIYEQVAAQVSRMLIRGIAYAAVLFATMVLLKILEKALKIISKIEGISQVNKAAGLIVGAVKGLLLIWLAFAGIAVFAATEPGMALSSYIYENPLLVWLYENNLVLSIIMLFF